VLGLGLIVGKKVNANTFLNTFGAGRSEVSISGISTKRLTYSLKTIQPLSELNANSKQLTFMLSLTS
jgi:hypothetical protein